MYRGCAGCGGMCRLCVSPPPAQPPHKRPGVLFPSLPLCPSRVAHPPHAPTRCCTAPRVHAHPRRCCVAGAVQTCREALMSATRPVPPTLRRRSARRSVSVSARASPQNNERHLGWVLPSHGPQAARGPPPLRRTAPPPPPPTSPGPGPPDPQRAYRISVPSGKCTSDVRLPPRKLISTLAKRAHSIRKAVASWSVQMRVPSACCVSRVPSKYTT